jgi:NADPH2:quinone reductase
MPGVEGRLVLIAFMKASRIECDWRRIMMKRLTVHRLDVARKPVRAKAALARELRSEVWPLLERGALKTVIHATFRWPKRRRRTR